MLISNASHLGLPRRSQSLDDVTAGSTHDQKFLTARSSPDLFRDPFLNTTTWASDTLWRNNPDTFYTVREQLMRYDTPASRQFGAAAPEGFIADTIRTPLKAFVQPTYSSCNIATFITATQDLLGDGVLGGTTPLARFVHLIEQTMTGPERDDTLKNGMNLNQFSVFANKVFKQGGIGWRATCVEVPKTSIADLQSLFIEETSSRFIVNYGGKWLYTGEGTGGHFGYVNSVNKSDDGVVLGIAETAPYRYPKHPLIPLRALYNAMEQPGSDGSSRGVIQLSPDTPTT